jgi:fibronectin type 3 domain-containing protein
VTAPTNLQATAGDGSVELTWNSVTGADTYTVKRSTTSGGTYTTLQAGVTTPTYTDNTATNGTTYYYVVSASNTAGESANSTQASATPEAPLTAPAAPANLQATAGDGSVELTWNSVTGADTYTVKRSTTSGGTYTTLQAGVTTPTYTDNTATNGTTYYYVVSASNTAGESANSTQASATPEAPLTAPAAPANLQATAGDGSVELTWNSVTGADTYTVKRSTTSGGTYTTLQAGVTTPTYTDNTATNGTTYYYVVSASNTAGESANSTQASATPEAPLTAPAAPANLQATAGDGSVELTWNSVTGADTYTVKRSTTSGGTYTTLQAGVTTPTYTDNTATNGTTYYYVVSASNTAGESANSTQASATPEAPLTAPAAPANLQATAGDGSVELTWNSVTGADTYTVKRSTTSGGTYTTLQAGVTTPTYTDNTATNGTTYYYVVSASNTAGESANSTQASATPEAPLTAPAAPANLQATAGDGSVELTWNSVTGADTYTVKRSTTSGGTYTTLQAGVTTPTYTDNTATNGTTYYYVVSASNTAGESANSTQASATPEAPLTAPAAPANLQATAGDGSVELTWNSVTGADTYTVKRSTTSGGTYTTLQAGVTTPTYTDNTATNGTTYYYVVSASNTAGESANSTQASATPEAPLTAPAAPANLQATAGDGSVELTWNSVTGADTYTVKRSTTSGGTYTTLQAGVTTPTYTDNTATNGTTYYYVVSASNTAGESANSTQASATPEAPLTAPAAPANLQATAGDGSVELTWNSVTGADTYTVKRSTTSGGTYTTLQAGVTTPTYTDNTATNGTTYYYVVSASNTAGESANSTQASATPEAPLTAPAAPANLQATAGDGSVELTWNSVTGADTYTVKRSTTSGGTYTTLQAGVTTPTYTDNTATNGTTYYYVVSASNTAGESANSTQASATPEAPLTAPAAPANLQATAGDGSVELTWNSVTGADTYTVKRSTTSGGTYTTLQAGVTTPTYTDNTATNGTTYYYVVSASNTAGESANSTQASATPEAPALAIPAGLLITTDSVSADISWNSVPGATDYTLQRSTSAGGAFSNLATGITATTFSDDSIVANPSGTTLPVSSNYYYRLVATSSGGNSDHSIILGAQPNEGGVGECILWLSPVENSVSVSSVAQYTMLLDTGSSSVDTVQVRVSFDPAILRT